NKTSRRIVLGRMFMQCPDLRFAICNLRLGIQIANRKSRLLSGSLTDHHEHGLDQDDQIKPPTGFFDVFEVVLDPLLEVVSCAAGAANLPKSGNAGTD